MGGRFDSIDRSGKPNDESDEKYGTGSQRLACRFENGLEGQVIR